MQLGRHCRWWLGLLCASLLFGVAGGDALGVGEPPPAPVSVTRAGGRAPRDFNPYIVAIPGSGRNRSALMVSASGIDEQAAPVYINADQGPTSHKHSYAMAFDVNDRVYRYTLDNFFENAGAVSGSIEITTTAGVSATLSSGQRRYTRWPVFRDEDTRLETQNGDLALALDPETLPADLVFILAVETLAPVEALQGWQAVSNAYSIQPSGSVGLAERPYLLALRYREEWLEGADAAALSIHRFDPQTETWQALGGNVHAERREVVLATRRFGTFMLFIPTRSPALLYLPAVNAAGPASNRQ